MDRGTTTQILIARPSSVPQLAWAKDDDGDAIAALLAAPMPGAMRFVLSDRPDHCVPRSDTHVRHSAIIVRGVDGAILGHGARTVRRLWIAGQSRWMGYLHGLRQAPTLHGDGRRLARALRILHEQRADDEVTYDFTAILNGNFQARRVLEAGLRGAPAYHHLTDYTTLICDVRVARTWTSQNITLRRCPDEAFGLLHELIVQHAAEYAPADHQGDTPDSWWTAWRGDRLVGAARHVDRCGERREFVDSYVPWLAAIRPILNVGLWATRRPMLPAPHTPLATVYAANLISTEDNDEIIRMLLAGVASDTNCNQIVWGLGNSHSLASIQSTIPGLRICSRLYAVGKRPDLPQRPISPEAAWL